MRHLANRLVTFAGVVLTAMLLLMPREIVAQQESIEERLKKLEEQNQQLMQLVQQLQQKLEALEKPEKVAMPTDIEELLKVEPAAPQASGAVGQPSGDPALNPEIAFTFDFVANAFDKQPEDYAIEGTDMRALGLRSLEVNAKRGVSVYGDAFVTLHVAGEHTHAEEAYIDLNRMVNRWNFRLGQWRPDFGPYNRSHEHQLPFVNYPRTLTNYFGPEGIIAKGAEVTFLPKFGDYSELRIGAYRGIGGEEGIAFQPIDDQNCWSYSGRFRYNKQLDPLNDLDFTASYIRGPSGDTDPSLIPQGGRTDAISLAVQWRKDRGNRRTDRVILEWLGCHKDAIGDEAKSSGWSAMYMKQLNLYNTWGLLYEDSEFGDIARLDDRVKAWSVFYTWSPQEQHEFRLQFRRSNYPTAPDTNELIFQSAWSIGNHSHEFQ